MDRQVAEQHAPAVEQLLGDRLGQLVPVQVSVRRAARATSVRRHRPTRRHRAAVVTMRHARAEARRRGACTFMRERMAPKPSDMTSPRATPSHSARSISRECGASPRPARRRSWRRARAAPRAPRRSRRTAARCDASAPRAAASSQLRSLAEHDGDRRGLDGDAVAVGVASSHARGVSRSQATSPSWHSRSSQRRVVVA